MRAASGRLRDWFAGRYDPGIDDRHPGLLDDVRTLMEGHAAFSWRAWMGRGVRTGDYVQVDGRSDSEAGAVAGLLLALLTDRRWMGEGV